MLISTLDLEAKALRAFREEPETESDSEDEGADARLRREKRRLQAEGGAKELELESYSGCFSESGRRGRALDAGAARLQYMGGEKERGGKKKNKKENGCIERLLRMSESRNS